MTLEKDTHLINDFPSTQKGRVSVADSRAEIQSSHASHRPFPTGICYYLGLHWTSGMGEAHRERWEGCGPQPTHSLCSPGSLRELPLPGACMQLPSASKMCNFPTPVTRYSHKASNISVGQPGSSPSVGRACLSQPDLLVGHGPTNNLAGVA